MRVNESAMVYAVGFPPTTQRKSAMNTFAPGIYIRDTDFWLHLLLSLILKGGDVMLTLYWAHNAAMYTLAGESIW